VLEYNLPAAQARMARAAVALGESAQQGEAALARKLIERTVKLAEDSGIRLGLRNHGVTEALLPKIADKAFEDACHQLNPRPTTRDDLLNIARAAL
jgi:alcohol dehydrogenase class IV